MAIHVSENVGNRGLQDVSGPEGPRHREVASQTPPIRQRGTTVTTSGQPLGLDAKARIMAAVVAWNVEHKMPGQHYGPITHAHLRVLRVLLYKFHNLTTGACYPTYEMIARLAECRRSSVRMAIRRLEETGVMTWNHSVKPHK